MKILTINTWNTIQYPKKVLGTASITKTHYRPNLYLMEGVCGYELFQVTKTINIIELRINGEVVMIDDPMHWLGMKELAKYSSGRVLIGGLGLGLILHHFVGNKKVTCIDVIEINKDVIALIKSLLPKDARLHIHHDNVYAYQWVHGQYDTIILDLWVKHNKKDIELAGQGKANSTDIVGTYLRFKFNNPKSKIYIWGHRNPSINPAVTQVSKEYEELLKQMS